MSILQPFGLILLAVVLFYVRSAGRLPIALGLVALLGSAALFGGDAALSASATSLALGLLLIGLVLMVLDAAEGRLKLHERLPTWNPKRLRDPRFWLELPWRLGLFLGLTLWSAAAALVLVAETGAADVAFAGFLAIFAGLATMGLFLYLQSILRRSLVGSADPRIVEVTPDDLRRWKRRLREVFW